jgi:uncharacterized cupredoxin-like copper-binding protein
MFNSNAPSKDDLPTSRQLAISTVAAAAVAAVILTTIVLPSEYAIDPTGVGGALGLTAMGEIKQQLTEEAEADRVQNVDAPATRELPKDQGSSLMETIGSFFISSAHAQEMKQDEKTVELAPGASTEIKLQMKSGAKVTYSWTAAGGHLNYDLHADGADGASTSYKKGRAQPGDEGELVAAFDGWHGWFWRNRSDANVTLTIKASGDFTEMKTMK